MATQAEIAHPINLDLEDIAAELADLPSVAEDWDRWSESGQTSFVLEWSNTAGGMKRLDQVYRSGQMTPDQQVRYRDLLAKLKEALPIIERLNLYRPPVPLEA